MEGYTDLTSLPKWVWSLMAALAKEPPTTPTVEYVLDGEVPTDVHKTAAVLNMLGFNEQSC